MLSCKTAKQVLERNRELEDPVDELTLKQAREVLDSIRAQGEAGLRQHALRLGDIAKLDEPIVISKQELKDAFLSMSVAEQQLLERTAQRIKHFAQAQRNALTDVDVAIQGGRAGHQIAPVEFAGCYAPGGRYPLPSSVLMTACTARVAGVKTIVVCSPKPHVVTLAAAHVAGADYFVKIGGAGAIGLMAYGCLAGIPACDVIVGPGNRWVTAAKSLVSGKCGIDMLAGPSECLVWGDDSACASTVASDLLAQSEHDVDAIPILVTTSSELVGRVQHELESQLATLPTAPTAREAVKRQGFYVLCESEDQALAVVNSLGPEHLEVITKQSQVDAAKCTSYGGLFVGGRSAEVFGDYGAGPNHVLPTSNTARYTGGLSVFTFIRIRTWLRIEDEHESQALVQDAAQLARLEGLEGHARASEQRLLSGAKRLKQ
ncbi:histidinol dehydrogenase [Batrachochytrium salamandrivorans]|nr:histidinol dehydrogenase [Batrachochytrium salamandrivorans]KAH9262890.1 histidinol dehydrogenase [Batrachochytrium salamandrivorans]